MDDPQSGNLSLSPLADAGRCKGCGYSLRALTVPRCPECGRPFDPGDPETMDLPKHLRPKKPDKPPEPFGDTMVSAAMIVVAFAAMNFMFHGFLAGCVQVVAWCLIGVSWAGRNHASPEQLRRQAEGYRHWRRVLKAALAISMLSFIQCHSCCHADTAWFGPIGISHSTRGGPCHDGIHNGGTHIAGNWYWAW
jgi:hypothetical protein